MNTNKTILNKVREITKTPAPAPALELKTYETKFGKLAEKEQKNNDAIWGNRNNSR